MNGSLDFRSLDSQAQTQLRIRAVDAVLLGISQVIVAKIFHVSAVSVCRWMKRLHDAGRKALKAQPRGTHKKGGILSPIEQAWTAKAIDEHSPQEMNLPFSLWSRAAVAALIEQEFGKKLSKWSVGRYLARWGFTSQKPGRGSYEQNPKEKKRFIYRRYPAIARSARENHAIMMWNDESGFRSTDTRGRSYGRRGNTPVIPASGKRFGCNMCSAISSSGCVRTKVFCTNFRGAIFIAFLAYLMRSLHEMIYLIIDAHPVHLSRAVKEWLKKHKERIRCFLLPSYSPEINPDEYLNNDVKTNAVARSRPRNLRELTDTVRRALNARVHSKKRIQAYFHHHNVVYALE